ncbi:ATP-binding protein [Brevibacillus laterosporus]|uniref:ATP-binding protein n=1 Tax=Brevibacillus laterosporus TaxID=1465 RepID=UPI003D20AFA8
MGTSNHANKFDLPITVSARVIYQLGEELISDEFVALAELIKNSYDADCRKVSINVDTKVETKHGLGRIVINDNGNGMVPSIIENAFLRISSNFKKIEKFSPYFQRRTLGNKGLGRLSIQRLGHHVTVYTSPRMDRLSKIVTKEDIEIYEKFNEYKVEINWLDFRDDNQNNDLSSVKASIEYRHNEKVKQGTVLIIEGIRNIDFWKLDRRVETQIKSEIFGMVNPFIQDKSQRFKVTLEVDDKKITNDDIEENLLSLTSDVEVEFSLKDWVLDLKILNKKRYIERLKEETTKKMEEKGFSEWEILQPYEDKEILVHIDLLSNFNETYPYLRKIEFQSYFDINLNKRIKAYPGNFVGKLYATDKSQGALNEDKAILNEQGYPFSTIKEIRSILDAANGVYLFRNDFRILPYGPWIDWFKFGYRSQRQKANIYKPHTVSGYVDLDTITSDGLQEQTNRQGLIEDEYGTNFFKIIEDIISEVVFREDTKLRQSFIIEPFNHEDKEIRTSDGNIIATRVKASVEEKKKIINLLESETKKLNNLPSKESIITQLKVLKDTAQEEEDHNKQEKFRYEQEIAQLKSLVGLAGQGIIVESLTHELNKIESSISDYARESKRTLLTSKLISQQDIHKISNFQDAILHEVSFLQMQLKHLEPTYRKNRAILSQISIKSLLKELYQSDGPMSQKAQKANINVNILGEDILIKANKGILVTIFDNIFLNSLYWVNQNVSKKKSIQFELDTFESSIVIWDSGPGFHPDIVKRIFEPYESMKPDGRGLGLYIVKELIRSLNGSIEIIESEKNGVGNCYKMKTKFPSH